MPLTAIEMAPKLLVLGIMKLLIVSLILILFGSPIARANTCEHYFQDVEYKGLLNSMGVKFIEEKTVFIFGKEIQVATILPDTETVLGSIALELMQYSMPVVLRVSNLQNVAGIIPEKGGAFFSSEQIYPLSTEGINKQPQIILTTRTLKNIDAMRVVIKHEAEHARLRTATLKGKSHPIVSLFYRGKPLKDKNLPDADAVVIEEIHTYAAHAMLAAKIILEKGLVSEFHKYLVRENNPDAASNGFFSRLTRFFYSKNVNTSNDALFEMVINGLDLGSYFARSSLPVMQEVLHQLGKGNVSFKLKQDRTWAIIDWADGSTFYMPVFGIHPKTHSKLAALEFTIQEAKRLESLILEYQAFYKFLGFVFGVGRSGGEFSSQNLEKILKVLRLPHLSDTSNKNPITFDKLRSEFKGN